MVVGFVGLKRGTFQITLGKTFGSFGSHGFVASWRTPCLRPRPHQPSCRSGLRKLPLDPRRPLVMESWEFLEFVLTAIQAGDIALSTKSSKLPSFCLSKRHLGFIWVYCTSRFPWKTLHGVGYPMNIHESYPIISPWLVKCCSGQVSVGRCFKQPISLRLLKTRNKGPYTRLNRSNRE